jgi:hypothetical protein
MECRQASLNLLDLVSSTWLAQNNQVKSADNLCSILEQHF